LIHAIGLDPEGLLADEAAAKQEAFLNLISTQGTA
jgi:hypothetical protein